MAATRIHFIHKAVFANAQGILNLSKSNCTWSQDHWTLRNQCDGAVGQLTFSSTATEVEKPAEALTIQRL